MLCILFSLRTYCAGQSFTQLHKKKRTKKEQRGTKRNKKEQRGGAGPEEFSASDGWLYISVLQELKELAVLVHWNRKKELIISLTIEYVILSFVHLLNMLFHFNIKLQDC